jgi:hypothetical protein
MLRLGRPTPLSPLLALTPLTPSASVKTRAELIAKKQTFTVVLPECAPDWRLGKRTAGQHFCNKKPTEMTILAATTAGGPTHGTHDAAVWARPVGVAVAHDGALLVSEDGNGTLWRVSYRGGP